RRTLPPIQGGLTWSHSAAAGGRRPPSEAHAFVRIQEPQCGRGNATPAQSCFPLARQRDLDRQEELASADMPVSRSHGRPISHPHESVFPPDRPPGPTKEAFSPHAPYCTPPLSKD